MTDGSISDRVTRLEVEMREVRIDIGENKKELKGIRSDLYSIKTNELKHYKNGRTFWLKFLGAGSLGAILLKLIEYLPEVLKYLTG